MFCAAAALKIGKKFHLWFQMYENTNWIDLVRGINYSRHQYPTRSPCCCTLTVFENILSGARFGKMLMLKLLWPHVLKDTTTIADTWVPITKGGKPHNYKGGNTEQLGQAAHPPFNWNAKWTHTDFPFPCQLTSWLPKSHQKPSQVNSRCYISLEK